VVALLMVIPLAVSEANECGNKHVAITKRWVIMHLSSPRDSEKNENEKENNRGCLCRPISVAVAARLSCVQRSE